MSRAAEHAGRAVPVDFVAQDLDDLPDGAAAPAGRAKPWGTGHAVFALRQKVEGPFLVVNADDFYGPRAIESFGRRAADGLEAGDDSHFLGAYELHRTGVSRTSGVNRGIVAAGTDETLAGIDEIYDVRVTDAGLVGRDGGGDVRNLARETLCSMNLWAFQPSIFGLLEAAFADFHAHLEDPLQDEFLLSETVGHLIGQGSARVRLLPMTQSTAGLTYPGDLPRSLPPCSSASKPATTRMAWPSGSRAARPGDLLEAERSRLGRPRRVRGSRARRRPRLRPALRLRHRPVLPRRSQPAVVAAWHVDGRHDLLDRHAEPGHRPGAQRRRLGQLDVVGVPDHRHVHDVLLREALAALRRLHRHRLLRTALLGSGGRLPARLPGGVPGRLLQRDGHGGRAACRDQDRRRTARCRQVHDGAGRRRRDGCVLGHLRPLGRRRHGPHAVRHRDGGFRSGRVVRAGAPGRRRALGPRLEPRHRLASRPAARLRRLGDRGQRLPDPGRRPVVVHLVSGRRTGGRRLRGPAHARRAQRAGLDGRDAVVQHRPLRAAAVAVDPGRPGFAGRLSDPGLDRCRLPAPRSVDHPARPRLSGDARLPAARSARPGRCFARGGADVDHLDPSELGRLLHRRRRVPSLRSTRARRIALRPRRPAVDDRPRRWSRRRWRCGSRTRCRRSGSCCRSAPARA